MSFSSAGSAFVYVGQEELAGSGSVRYLLLQTLSLLFQDASDVIALGCVFGVPPFLLFQVCDDLP